MTRWSFTYSWDESFISNAIQSKSTNTMSLSQQTLLLLLLSILPQRFSKVAEDGSCRLLSFLPLTNTATR